MILEIKNATNGLARAKGKSQRISYGDGLTRLDRPGGTSSRVCRVHKHGNRRDFGLGSCKKVSLAQHVHNLAFLRTQAERIDMRLVDAWPRERREDRARFEKLKEAYV